MRIVTLCLVLLGVLALLAGGACPGVAAGVPIDGPLDPTKWLGHRVEGTLVIAASPGPPYLLSGWTGIRWRESLPDYWEWPDLAPHNDGFAFGVTSAYDVNDPWATRCQVWRAERDGSLPGRVTTCTPLIRPPWEFFQANLEIGDRARVFVPVQQRDLPQLEEPRSPPGKASMTEKAEMPPLQTVRLSTKGLHWGPLPSPQPGDDESWLDDCINCMPLWSPDGSMLAYNHCQPQLRVGVDENAIGPCSDPGFSYWMANADGSNPRRVNESAAEAYLLGMGWSPDGSKLLYSLCQDPHDTAVIVDRTQGLARRELLNVGYSPNWSPDGSQLVSVFWEVEHFAKPQPFSAAPGVWVRLRLTDIATDSIVDPDEPIWEHFVPGSKLSWGVGPLAKPSEAKAYLAQRTCLLPKWSPTGRYVAFLGLDWEAIEQDNPVLPEARTPEQRAFLRKYVQVYMVDVETRESWQITSDERFEHQLRWSGSNTSSDTPGINVGTVGVTFLHEVSTAGRTSVMWQESSPALGSGYRALSEVYNLQTSAVYSGGYEIDMVYSTDGLSTDDVDRVRIMWYDAASSTWEATTALTAPEAGIARGLVESGVPSLQEPVLFVVALTPGD